LKPVSEKTFEILFNKFLLQSFNLGELVLYAPTSYEEFTNGYDTKITGLGSFREIILQFKSPTINKKGDLFTVDITKHQHEVLKDYDNDTAYYVIPTFRSIKELNEIQASIKNATDFLKHCICIDVSSLPEQVDFIHYNKPESHKESPLIKYKTPKDGTAKKAKHSIKGKAWMRGSTLAERFKSNSVGSVVDTNELYEGDNPKAVTMQSLSNKPGKPTFSAVQIRKNI
jgi:hypothetical protein